MLRCVPYRESMEAEWDQLALTCGTVFHTTAFRRVLIRSLDYQCGYHAITDGGGNIRALMPLMIGRNLRLKRVGVVLPFVNYTDLCAVDAEAAGFAAAAFMKLKETCRLDYLEVRLRDQELDPSFWKGQLNNVTFLLPLTAPEDQVLALSTASNRNHVRKAYKNNWFRVSFDQSHLDEFYGVYAKRMKQLGSPVPDIGFFQAFFEYLPDNTFLLTVQDRETGGVVGGMLLLTSPGDRTLYYPYGANLIEYNGKYLNNFMYWEAVRFGIGKGLKHLDLGRSPVGSGTYKYKEQWGAQAVPLKYLVYDGGREKNGPPAREDLQIFIELWKKLPKVITDQVGKHLIKYIMP